MESLVASVPAVRSALAAAAITVVTTLATRVGHDPLLLPALVAIVAATALLVPLGQGLLVALTGWAMLTGFAVNTDGRLTAHAGDLHHLAVLVGVAVLAWSLAGGVRPAVVRGRDRAGAPARRAAGPVRAGTPARSR